MKCTHTSGPDNYETLNIRVHFPKSASLHTREEFMDMLKTNIIDFIKVMNPYEDVHISDDTK